MHILIIEDEKQLCQSIAEGLRMDGYEADTCFDGDEGLELCLVENYDLILLDLNLPGVDGLEILRQFRESDTSTPVLILSARGQIQDKVEGLDLGANDYITKPFGMMEFVARVKAVLRRCSRQEEDKELKCDDLRLSVGRHKVYWKEEKVELTRKEFELLQYLMENKGLVMTRNQILCHVWGYDFDGETRTVDVHVRTLRQKLGEAGNLIETVRGVGYRIGA